MPCDFLMLSAKPPVSLFSFTVRVCVQMSPVNHNYISEKIHGGHSYFIKHLPQY